MTCINVMHGLSNATLDAMGKAGAPRNHGKYLLVLCSGLKENRLWLRHRCPRRPTRKPERTSRRFQHLIRCATHVEGEAFVAELDSFPPPSGKPVQPMTAVNMTDHLCVANRPQESPRRSAGHARCHRLATSCSCEGRRSAGERCGRRRRPSRHILPNRAHQYKDEAGGPAHDGRRYTRSYGICCIRCHKC